MQLRLNRGSFRWRGPNRLSSALLLLSLGFPILLVVHAVYAARELNQMRSIFLRERAAAIAARLELMPPAQVQRNDFEELLEGDPAILRISVFRSSDRDPANPRLQAVRSGSALYATEEIHAGGETVFRAHVPFHSAGQVHVAQIDLASNAPEYLLVHARNNLAMAIASSAILLLLSMYGLWS